MGNNYDCRTRPYTDLYEMPYILNADRSRWSGGGFDWTSIPTPDGNAAPLSEDWNVMENNQPNPVAADLVMGHDNYARRYVENFRQRQQEQAQQ